jgi:putative polyketide hydroxylase
LLVGHISASTLAHERTKGRPHLRRDLRSAATSDETLAHPFVLAAGGFQYPSGAFVGGLDEGGEIEPVGVFEPAGRVGTRVPHVWLDEAHTRSTLDLAGPGWALVVKGDPAAWERGAAAAPLPLPVHRLAGGFLPEGCALLLRPDQVVGWRGTDPTAPADVLRRVLTGGAERRRTSGTPVRT